MRHILPNLNSLKQSKHHSCMCKCITLMTSTHPKTLYVSACSRTPDVCFGSCYCYGSSNSSPVAVLHKWIQHQPHFFPFNLSDSSECSSESISIRDRIQETLLCLVYAYLGQEEDGAAMAKASGQCISTVSPVSASVWLWSVVLQLATGPALFIYAFSHPQALRSAFPVSALQRQWVRRFVTLHGQ